MLTSAPNQRNLVLQRPSHSNVFVIFENECKITMHYVTDTSEFSSVTINADGVV